MTAPLLLALLLPAADPKPADKDDLQQMLQKEREEKNRLLVLVDVLRAEKAWAADDLGGVRELVDRHVPAKGAPDYRGPEWHALHALYRHQLRDLTGPVGREWQWHANGRLLAMTGLGGGGGSVVTVRDVHTGDRFDIKLDGREQSTTANWSPDGRWLGLTGRTSTVVWDSTTKKEAILITRPEPKEFVIYHHGWSPDGKRIACPGSDGTVRVLETVTGKELLKLEPAGGAHTARWSPDGKRIAVAGPRGVAAFAADTGKPAFAHEFKTFLPIRVGVEWSPKGAWLVVVGSNATHVLDGNTGEKKWALAASDHFGGVIRPNWSSLKWHSDNDNLMAWVGIPSTGPAMAPHGLVFALWDLKTGKRVHDGEKPTESPFQKKEDGPLGGYLFWVSGDRLLRWSASPDNTTRFTAWGVSPMKPLGGGQLTTKHWADLRVYALSPDGKRLAAVVPADSTDRAVGASDTLVVLDTETGKEAFRSRAFLVSPSGNEGASAISWSPDGTRILLAGGRADRLKLKVFDATAVADKKP